MAIGRAVRDTETDPFYDMLFNMLIAFVFLFVIAILSFNPKARKAGDIPAKAEFIVTVSWPDNNPNDVDAWVLEPGGKTLWFRQRDAGMVHLDRDDRGAKNSSVIVNGREVGRNFARHTDQVMAWYRPYLVPLPAGSLVPGINTVEIRVSSQDSVGIGRVMIGPNNAIRDNFNTQFFWQITAPLAANFAMLMMGVLAVLPKAT